MIGNYLLATLLQSFLFLCTSYRIWQNFQGGKLCSFRGFLTFRESFTAIRFCVNDGSYGTTGKTRSFSSKRRFCLVTVKVFPLESFAVYGIAAWLTDN